MRIERLVEVIVGALFERHGAFGRLADSGEEHDGRPVAGAAQLAQGLAAVEPRHEHVHDDHGRRVRRDPVERGLAVVGDVDVEARAGQERREVGRDVGLVVDQEQPRALGVHRNRLEAMNQTLAGRSARRRMKYGYQCVP